MRERLSMEVDRAYFLAIFGVGYGLLKSTDIVFCGLLKWVIT